MINPLGWKSAIYDLARTGTSLATPMGEVTDDLLRGVTSKIEHASGPLTRGERFIEGLGFARSLYEDAITIGRGGADDASMAVRFGELADELEAVGRIGVSGTPQGHVRTAWAAARDVSRSLHAPGATEGGVIPKSLHERIWSLRNELDEGWNSIGTARVLGTFG